ncbi:MAG: hypothetical protein OXG24_09210 [Gammaproteobacteria bacterium]|nr:hypothetical protein [Gammaproteobacteria bacterium]
MKQAKSFDRSIEDVGNVLNLEHFNFTVPDQELAALFYVSGLGFTRDPYMDFATFNMWVNVGEQQFHLPKSDAQVFRGHITLVIPNHDDLKRRLNFVTRFMDGTKFSWLEEGEHIQVSCPWGNEFLILEPNGGSDMHLGISSAEMLVPTGSADGISRFYREILDTPAEVKKDNGTTTSVVQMGYNQSLLFTESEDSIADYDGHHVAIYISNFSGPHKKLQQFDAIAEESDQHQYRFQRIFDPSTGETLTELEHEVRSLHHPMKRRVLVNRNASQTFGNYRTGRDAFVPT